MQTWSSAGRTPARRVSSIQRDTECYSEAGTKKFSNLAPKSSNYSVSRECCAIYISIIKIMCQKRLQNIQKQGRHLPIPVSLFHFPENIHLFLLSDNLFYRIRLIDHMHMHCRRNSRLILIRKPLHDLAMLLDQRRIILFVLDILQAITVHLLS